MIASLVCFQFLLKDVRPFKFEIVDRHTACLNIGISKVQDFESFELLPRS